MPLMVPDLDALRRKLENPPAGLDGVYARFQQRLAGDHEFRGPNIYLSALLGNVQAQEEAKAQVLMAAADYGTRPDNDYQFDMHTWCSAAPAMRQSVYFDWLDSAGLWSEAEREEAARGLLHFGYVHCVNTLRSRFPAADNQSLSMSLFCAVTGWVFRTCPAVAERAEALHRFGMDQIETRLGLAPPDGYMGEGSTYQMLVVTPLTMWIGAFFSSLQGPEALIRHWEPNGATLLDILRVDAYLRGPGLLLPPWDHYGWQGQTTLSPLAYYAAATGQPGLLARAGEIWDCRHNMAWSTDDRMWALLFWPDQPLPEAAAPAPALSGWSLPQTAAVIDDSRQQARLMLAWDLCSWDRQGLARKQVNPNHVMYEAGGVPLFGDGIPEDNVGLYLGATAEEIAAPLGEEEQALIAAQWGSVEKWAMAEQPGFIGAANTVIVDGEYGYFPVEAKRGRLAHEEREENLHVVTAESLDYYTPRYDLTRARRTIATCANGLSWIVDDYRAESEHTFTWQAYLRRGCRIREHGLTLRTPEGQTLEMAWLPVEKASLELVPDFPRQEGGGTEGRCWPQSGSERLRLETRGTEAAFVMCLLPGGEGGLTMRRTGEREWLAEWPGGSGSLHLPGGADQPTPPLPYPPEYACDLDQAPFDLPEDPVEILLAALERPAPEDWRATVRAMQALTERRVPEAMPLIQALLGDRGQQYQVTSVAAWCLGRARYRPALADLRYMTHAPETNTNVRSRCAVEVMGGD